VRVRHCPACRTDYRPEIAVCADCGGQLEDRDDELDPSDAPSKAPPSRSPDELPEEFEPIHTSRDIDELPPLADALVAAGIECRMRSANSDQRATIYRLFVRSQDRTAAAALLQPMLTSPDVDDFDPARGYARCPACDLALEPRTLQCPECGLLLGAAQTTCRECGAPVDADAERCEGCGAVVAEAD
jgi:hypothetical protein